ncbi:hypothetical protein KCP69_01180 [Salmonella enterica subsp. enterica]|nr:hypothetical protein KCP69_01180 [Salmonella enterica subsp. enterica]
MFWRFVVNIEFNKRKQNLATTIFAGRRAAAAGLKTEKQMDFYRSAFTPDTHRAVIAGKAAGKRWRR